MGPPLSWRGATPQRKRLTPVRMSKGPWDLTPFAPRLLEAPLTTSPPASGLSVGTTPPPPPTVTGRMYASTTVPETGGANRQSTPPLSVGPPPPPRGRPCAPLHTTRHPHSNPPHTPAPHHIPAPTHPPSLSHTRPQPPPPPITALTHPHTVWRSLGFWDSCRASSSWTPCRPLNMIHSACNCFALADHTTRVDVTAPLYSTEWEQSAHVLIQWGDSRTVRACACDSRSREPPRRGPHVRPPPRVSQQTTTAQLTPADIGGSRARSQAPTVFDDRPLDGTSCIWHWKTNDGSRHEATARGLTQTRGCRSSGCSYRPLKWQERLPFAAPLSVGHGCCGAFPPSPPRPLNCVAPDVSRPSVPPLASLCSR